MFDHHKDDADNQGWDVRFSWVMRIINNKIPEIKMILVWCLKTPIIGLVEIKNKKNNPGRLILFRRGLV